MPFNLPDFRAHLKLGGARPTLFDVTMPFPTSAPNVDASTKLTYTCEAASMPGVSIGSIVIPYFGRETKWPGDKKFEDWNITVINDEDFKVRNAFELWYSKLNSHAGNLRDAAAVEATGWGVDIYIKQYSRTGDPIKGYKIIGAFPVDLGAIDVAWRDTDRIETFSVRLAYQWWENDQTEGQGGNVLTI